MFSYVFHTLLHLSPSVPVFIARQHFCQRFIALLVFREVRTFSYCFTSHCLKWCFLHFIALPGVYCVISNFVRFIALINAVRFIALVVVMPFITLVIAVRFIALVIVVRFVAFIDAARFIAFCIVVSSVCCYYCSI